MTIDFSALQSVYNDQMNMLLANTGLTTRCLLNYGITKKDICPNCIYDSNLKKSANKYKTGGPKPFVNGRICPYCNGAGYHGLIKVDEIYLAVIWDYKHWINKPINIQNPTGMIQTICSRVLFDKLKKAKDLTIIYRDTTSNPLFKILEEPNPVGLGDNNYLICNWERTGISSITENMITRPLVGLNVVNYANSSGNIMYPVGTVGGPSAYGTYDQNGNAEEWTGTRDTASANPIKIYVAGGYSDVAATGLSNAGIYSSNQSGTDYRGFRIASLSNPLDLPNMVLVNDKYNRADTNGYGSVNYDFYIEKYEVTYSGWCDFVNSMASYAASSGIPADSDTYGIVNEIFLSGVDYVSPTGFPGYYTFTPVSGYSNQPIVGLNWLDCLRYCNWQHNNQPSGYQTVNNDGSTPNTSGTEGGAYALNGVTELSSFINPASAAKYRMPTLNEWYKAGFYKSTSTSGITPSCAMSDYGYWDYATQNDKLPSSVN